MIDLGHWFEESYAVAGEKVLINNPDLEEDFNYDEENSEEFDI